MSPELRTLQSRDWLDDLGEFPAAIVAEACTEWRQRPGGRRPTPGDIRTICVESRTRKEELRRPALPPPQRDIVAGDFHERRYREAAEAREAAAKANGYESFKHAMAVGLRRAGLA